jgi:hypothetical protein
MKQRWALFSAVCLALTLAFCLAWPNPGGAAVRAQSEASDWWVELHPASSTNRGQYQGYLQTGGLPAGGSYDLQFTLYDAASGGVPLGEAISYENLQVSEGLFNVTLDWDGLGSSPAWVEVSLRLADDSAAESFTTLARRLPLSGAAGSSAPPTSTTALQPGAMLAPGDFTLKAASPVPLTCVTSDPNTGLVYAQADRGLGFYVYDPAADSWSTLAPSPLNSGNNGGAAYLGGKIYTVYTENSTSMGVYDIATDTWATIPNGLGVGTGVIASDGSYLYLAVGSTFKRYNPISATWADRAAPSIDIQPWGGMAYWNGRLYAHRGNGLTEFARYDIASNTWTTLPSLPDGAVLGSAIDPVRREYYAYGSYGDTNWYIFDLDAESWRVETIPFFNVNDGGMAYVSRDEESGVYFVQGEGGAGFGHRETVPPRVGDFTIKAASPVPLTCVTSDPNTGLVYAQANWGMDFYVYDPLRDIWSALPAAPLNSGNNGGAAYLGGKIYTVYTGNSTSMGVYDITTDTWATIPNGLGMGTGVIASDGSYLYLASGSTFKRYNPISATWADRAAPSIDIQPWGGMAYWNGRLYAHRGNGLTEFARYDIASNTWTTLPSLPDGAVLGSAIDPVRREYYAYGSYGGTNWYIFDLDAESWRVETIPFFSVNDGGMAYAVRGHASGVYFVQGEDGAGFGRYQDASPSNGLFAINDNAAYVNSTSVTINVYAEDPETGVSHMRFRNETPWRALLFQDAYPWDTDALQRVLDGYSLPYDLLPSSVMATSDLASYSQVIIPSDQPQDLYDAYDAERTRFEDYASNGGLVQFHAAAWGWHPGNLSGIPLPGGVSISQQYSEWNFITEPAHPLVAGIANPLRGIFASHATFSGLLDGNQTISTAGDAPGGNPTLIEYPLGDGKVIASGQTLEYGWHNNQAAWRILENMIPYAAGDMPWSASVPWTLEPGDGVKTVYAQFRNGAGLYSTVTTDTIILDTQPPVASATCMIGTSQTSIEVSWSGSDSLSGVSNYDVQYRVGAAGAWTDWPGLAATTLTSATFGPLSPLPVEHLQSYSFRVRAHDNAGNASAYAAAGDCSVSIEPASLYLPSLIR